MSSGDDLVFAKPDVARVPDASPRLPRENLLPFSRREKDLRVVDQAGAAKEMLVGQVPGFRWIVQIGVCAFDALLATVVHVHQVSEVGRPPERLPLERCVCSVPW